MVLSDSDRPSQNDFIVLEGTFAIDDFNISITTFWTFFPDEGRIRSVSIDATDKWVYEYSPETDTFTVTAHGAKSAMTRGQSFGVWSFAHRDTVAVNEFVTDKPYVVKNALTSIPGLYTGEWENDAPNGHGEFVNTESGVVNENISFKKDAIARGNWVNGLLEGLGEYICKETGDSFAGDFVKGLMTGFGSYTWGDGNSYIGYFENNAMHGEGTLTFADGEVMMAKFVNGQPDGLAIHTLPDGSIYDVEYEDGEIISVNQR